MSKSLSLILYNLLLPLGLIFMLPGALKKLKARGGRWSDMAQRFGFFPEAKQAALTRLPTGPNRLWMHAVSVGEVGIATKLISRILKEQPGLAFVVTTTTPTGHALAEEFAQKQPQQVVVLYSPVDLPWVSPRFLHLIQPSQIVLVEAELWPNLISAAKQRSIRVSMVNARLSARSEQRFKRFGFLIRPIFAMLDLVLVQELADAERLAGIGVRKECIQHTGSIKFDPQGAAIDEAQLVNLRLILEQAGIVETQPILLLASTHNGEEVLLAQVAQRLYNTYRDLALLIVPRHVERADEISSSLGALGITTMRRSQIHSSFVIPHSSLPTLLIDTTGELRAWQCLATAVVVGKSFLATGGQNPAEAVMAEKPVLFGPHMENFEPLVELLLSHHGAIQVTDVRQLESALRSLLGDAAACSRYGSAGHAALAAHEGATSKTMYCLLAS